MPDLGIKQGERFRLTVNASLATNIDAFVSIVYDDGQRDEIQVPRLTSGTTRVNQTSNSTQKVRRNGFIIGATVTYDTVPKRGQVYAQLNAMDSGLSRVGQVLCKGYLYGPVGLHLGEFVEPLGGPGYLDWTQEANDAAGNATTTVNLAASNARRMVRAVVVKVHSSGDVATRTWTITLRDLADSGGPTGWSIASDTWVSPTLTLTANEEGLMHIGEHGFVSVNDAGTLAYADNSSAPNPFPMMTEEGDSADLIIVAGAGEAADDYDVWVQYEEWIEV